ncbi:MAG: HD domain-containing protein [Bdellovibrionota bacterium]
MVQLRRALGEDAQLHLVGGTIRDALSGQEVKDLDCATSLVPDEILSRLAKAGIHVIPTGLQHQTVTAVPVEGEPGVEITTFRGPDMSPAGGVVASESINIDVQYRDFTINALAFDLAREALIDNVGGVADLDQKIIRAVGDARTRFSEDPLRVLRMVRFACKADFRISPETLDASAELADAIPQISVERVRDELSKILVSDRPKFGLRLLHDLGFLAKILPEIDSFVGFEQNEYHLYDLFDHTLEVVAKTPPELLIRLSALMHDVGKPATLSIDPESGFRHFFKHETVGAEMCRDILKRLRYPNRVVDEVCVLTATHMRPIESGPGGLRRLLRDTGDLFPAWRQLKVADATSCRLDLEEFHSRLAAFDAALEEVRRGPQVSPLKSLAVKGDDLLAAGHAAGPIIGKILRALHERVLDTPELNEKETLLALVPDVVREIELKDAPAT